MAAPAGGLEDAELREAQRDYLDFLDDEVRRAGRCGCCIPSMPPGVGDHLVRVTMSPPPVSSGIGEHLILLRPRPLCTPEVREHLVRVPVRPPRPCPRELGTT